MARKCFKWDDPQEIENIINLRKQHPFISANEIGEIAKERHLVKEGRSIGSIANKLSELANKERKELFGEAEPEPTPEPYKGHSSAEYDEMLAHLRERLARLKELAAEMRQAPDLTDIAVATPANTVEGKLDVCIDRLDTLVSFFARLMEELI